MLSVVLQDLFVFNLAYDKAQLGKIGRQTVYPCYMTNAHLELGDSRQRVHSLLR